MVQDQDYLEDVDKGPPYLNLKRFWLLQNKSFPVPIHTQAENVKKRIASEIAPEAEDLR
jgi:hypothetical protein